VPTTDLPLATRLWFAWLCFFRVLFDARFAARVWGARDAIQLPPTPPPSVAPAPASLAGAAAALDVSALQLVSLLQREGRLVDFVQQDIASYPDADVGVAARVVHEGCRRALRAHATVEAVRSEEEGAPVTLAPGFDADAVKLVGDVRGDPPYAGVLRHRGWRVTRLELPRAIDGHDPRIVAPAEVEL
jgi:hypothetical protein